jgi:hypothetical protein
LRQQSCFFAAALETSPDNAMQVQDIAAVGWTAMTADNNQISVLGNLSSIPITAPKDILGARLIAARGDFL